MSRTPAGEEAGKFLLWQRGDHLQAGQTLLTEIMTASPGSSVADYALLAFGRNLSRSFRNYAAGRIRESDCDAALQYFRRVRSDRLPALLQIQQYLDEARCYFKMSQPMETAASMKRADRHTSFTFICSYCLIPSRMC